MLDALVGETQGMGRGGDSTILKVLGRGLARGLPEGTREMADTQVAYLGQDFVAQGLGQMVFNVMDHGGELKASGKQSLQPLSPFRRPGAQ